MLEAAPKPTWAIELVRAPKIELNHIFPQFVSEYALTDHILNSLFELLHHHKFEFRARIV